MNQFDMKLAGFMNSWLKCQDRKGQFERRLFYTYYLRTLTREYSKQFKATMPFYSIH